MTAKEIANKSKDRVDMPILKDLYIFSEDEFNAFCEQLCMEQKELDYIKTYLDSFDKDLIMRDVLDEVPDWGQKGG